MGKSAATMGAVILLALLACKERPGDRGGQDGEASGVPVAPRAEQSAAAPAAPPSVEAEKRAAPPAATVACKSAAAGKPAVLGTRTDWVRAVRPWGDRVYLLSHNDQMARTTLSYFTRDGASNAEVGRHEGLGTPNPSTFDVTPEHAYFTQKRALLRFPLSGGKATVVSEDFATMARVVGDQAYGVRCAATGKRDELVRVPTAGGAVEVLATIERSAGKCQYGGLGVADGTVYVTDFEGRRLLAIEVSGGAVKELARGPAFAADLFVHEGHVDFTASGGLHRVPRAGGEAKIVSQVGDSPFGSVAFDGKEYWIFQAEPYETSEAIWRLPAAGGEPRKVFTFFVQDVTAGSGVDGIGVDDQCFYYAQRSGDGAYRTVYAQKKPD